MLMSCFLLSSFTTNAQDTSRLFGDYGESQWSFGGEEHSFTMNYTMFGKSVADGMWHGSLGYATGMWLSGNKTEWGIVGSILAVNIPLIVDKGYRDEEVWVGKNLGALTVSLSLTFTIEMYRNGKYSWDLPYWLTKH